MLFLDLKDAAKDYFPNLEIKYKNESIFMKILSKILFFKPDFMTSYSTKVGDTIYFPNKKSVQLRPISAVIILMHELVHMYDERKIGKLTFLLSYLFPQILSPMCLILLFWFSWKIVLLLALLFLTPIPAIFRAHFEKRAYLSSLYVFKVLGDKFNFDPKLEIQAKTYISYFKNSSYYFMWLFSSIEREFDQAIVKINLGNRPYEDPIFDMIDDLINKS